MKRTVAAGAAGIFLFLALAGGIGPAGAAHAPAAPSPTPTPTPPPCAQAGPLHAKLAQGFGDVDLRGSGAAVKGCSVDFRPVYLEHRDAAAAALAALPDPLPPDVSVGFSKSGFVLRYKLTQRMRPRAYVGYSAASSGSDDQIVLLLRNPKQGKSLFTLAAYANPLGVCSTISYAPHLAKVHDQCSTSGVSPVRLSARPNCAPWYCWSGMLVVPYDALAANGLFTFEVNVGRKLWGEGEVFVEYHYEPDVRDPESNGDVAVYSRWLHAELETSVDVDSEQFVTVAPTFGNLSGGQPHRLTESLVLPAGVHTFLGATLADASGSLLTLRDKSLKSILPGDQVKSFKCVSCASYQTDGRTAAWSQPVTTKNTLPIDFSKLGVDAAPFTFDAVGYPVDAGFKLIGGSASTTVAFASMHGLTPKNGSAYDDALALSGRTVNDENSVGWSLFQADANRTLSTLAGTRPEDGQHTHDTELSLGDRYIAERSDVGDEARATGIGTTYSTLLRYGTQHARAGERVDAALAFDTGFGFIASKAASHDRIRIAGVAGYRSVGSGYVPLDGDFDPAGGLRGLYAGFQYAQPPGSRHPVSVQLIGHKFSDGTAARDVAVTGSFAVRLGRDSPISVAANVNTAELAVSQVARLLHSSVPVSAAAGLVYLPNSSFSTNVAYTQKQFEANAGYAQTYAQNCRADLEPNPCYFYRQPSVTGGVFWRPIKEIFIDGSIQSQNNEALGLPGAAFDPVQKNSFFQQTTAGHIVRKAGIGLAIPHLKCSTLTFTTENRGGDVDAFAASPPQPGFTNTTSLEIAPSEFTPGILVAYARQGTFGATASAAASKQFFVRLLFGLPMNTFIARTTAQC